MSTSYVRSIHANYQRDDSLTLLRPPIWNRAGHYVFVLWFLLFSIFFSRLFSAVADLMSTILPHMVRLSANLGCMPEPCCLRLAGNAGRKKSPKNCHLRTIAQICWAVASQLKHVLTIRKKLVKQQYLLRTFSQYGELQPTNG